MNSQQILWRNPNLPSFIAQKLFTPITMFALAFIGVSSASVNAQVYQKVFDFTEAEVLNRGSYPRAGLVQGSDGNFYGTTQQGGENVIGTVFKMTAAGALTTLVEFTGDLGAYKGAYPGASLVQGSDGSFYGTTAGGLQYTAGNGHGTVFRMTPGGMLTTLVEFTGTSGPNKGAYPGADLVQGSAGGAGLVQGPDGHFYGTTRRGGVNDFGTVFKINSAGGTGALTTLGEFTGNQAGNKGAYPGAGLVLGSDGDYYGTTSGTDPDPRGPGGASFVNNGTVFKIVTNGTPAGTTLMTLVEFTGIGGDNKGRRPNAGLIQGNDGNFYGTTFGGGANDLGTVFKMTPAGMVTTLVEFTGNGVANKGSLPQLGLVLGSDGNFYGTTFNGGANDLGTVFTIATNGTAQGTTLTTLVHFTGTPGKGFNAGAGLVQGSDGQFYGTTIFGGVAASYGTVFKMATDGTPQGTTLTTLVEFTANGISDKGRKPFLGVQDSDGNFYGTCINGGEKDIGTVFKMTPTGSVTSLVEFTGTTGPNKGAYPRLRMVQGSDGNFYMTTERGGDNDLGTVFMITPDGVLTTLWHFDGNNGSRPLAGLIRDGAQTFYGTTERGGIGFNQDVNSGNGTVFKLVTDGTPQGTTLTKLVQFTGNGVANKGKSPSSNLVKGADGHFYGTTHEGGASGIGTVFKMVTDGTAAGTTLTTLVQFTGTGMREGAYPYAGLLNGNDGNFYGTTKHGGSSFNLGDPISSYGTVFRMETDGTEAGTTLTTLVEFTGISGLKPGSYPYGDLVQDSDGNFYGTTSAGGASNRGTVFKMVTNGTLSGTTLTNLREFLGGFDGEASFAGLIAAADGNLFGTTSGGAVDGTIFRLVFPGAPTVALRTVSLQHTSAVVDAYVNARGASTDVSLEYGTGSVTFPNTVVPLAVGLNGYQTKLVGTTLNGLSAGATYFYRIRATSSEGTTISPPMSGPPASFSTLAEPNAIVSPASDITANSARFNGMVNARNFDTFVLFEWGADGNTFPNSVPATPGLVTGNSNVAVIAAVAGLLKGTTYFYRIVAGNSGGTVVSGTQSFTTVDILSGFAQSFPNVVAFADRQGSVLVNLVPSGLSGAAWRFVGEQDWRASGVPATGLTTGDRTVEFRPVPGYIQPPPEPVSVTSGEAAVLLSREYYETESGSSGGLLVTLKPEALADAGVAQPVRAQWRFLGEGNPTDPNDVQSTTWRNSGVLVSAMVPGNYLVECKPVAGRTTPPPLNVLVLNGQTAAPTATYFLADALTGTLPGVLPFETVSTSTDLPYAYVGQIRSAVGASTGFVVKARVVATAAHVVFDDAALTAAPLGTPIETSEQFEPFRVQGLQWLVQRDRGTYEPNPQIPRGFYVISGYAAQRFTRTPGESTPQSQHLDAAALYFLEDAGRGGFGGYLASDEANNEFLLSPTSLKTLVGYPVDNIPAANRGRMHATPPAAVSFTRVPGEFAPGIPFKTYTTTAIRSTGGTSGGPLCVQLGGGVYYPAAIYLGGSGQTVVRAIDSQVIDLFDRAEVSGNSGPNNTGGGIVHVNSPIVGSFALASIRVDLRPAAAVGAGAKWRLGFSSVIYYGDGTDGNGEIVNNLSPATYTLYFSDIPGYSKPAATPVTLLGGQLVPIIASYAVDDAITEHPNDKTRSALDNVNFSVTVTGTPTGYQWKKNGANINGAAATLNPYTIPVVHGSDAAAYTCTVTWASGSQTSNPGTLTVTKISQSIAFPVIANRYLTDGSFDITALAGSELPVTFQILSGPATLSSVTETPTGSRVTVTPTGFGMVTVRARQAGDEDYNPVTKDRTFQVSGDNFDSWRARYFTPPELSNPIISGPLADFEGDGLNTLLEFSLNLNPKVSDMTTMIAGTGKVGLPLIRAENVGGQQRLTAEFVRRRAAGIPGITYRAEFTSDLANAGSWSFTGNTEVVTQIDEAWERVKVTDQQLASSVRYGRLKVTLP